MPISESQLETWSHQGAVTTSAAAYNSVQTALGLQTSAVCKMKPEIYLQGSYGNNTNIFEDSDIDIVVQLESVWGRDLSALPPDQQRLYNHSVSSASFPWNQFHA